MGRIARVVLPGHPHHIVQRGNFGQDVFLDDEDRARYIELLHDYSRCYGIKVWAYCLMTNHVHFVVVPHAEDSLARTFCQAHMLHSQCLNRRLGRVGHVWQARFYSCVLDDTHLLTAVRYVERNPVRAGLVRSPWEYDWSSARAHVSGAEDPLLDLACPLTRSIVDWRAYLAPDEDCREVEALRQAFRTGRQAGSNEFVSRLERLLGRPLTPRREGRPRKTAGAVPECDADQKTRRCP